MDCIGLLAMMMQVARAELESVLELLYCTDYLRFVQIAQAELESVLEPAREL